jgi:hypothetical protein
MKLNNLTLDRKSVVLGTLVGITIMLSVGAASSGNQNKWEYKVVGHDPNVPTTPEKQETLLNDLGAQGWTLIQNEGGWFYFTRAKR